jgi:putative phage-type endonuclease
MLTPEQLTLRKTGIGGSDAAAICGLSKYATPLDVYLSKTTDIVKEETEAMRRGILLEPFVKALFEHKTGWSVKEVLKTHRSSKNTFMLANLDGYLPSERAIAEFKTASYSSKADWGEEGTDEMPKEYLIQVAHYANVMDLDTVHVGVLFGGDRLFKSYIALQKIKEAFISYPIDFDELECDFRMYTYTKTSVLEDRLVKREKSFWFDYVQKEVMPPLQEGCLDDVLKAYPIASDQSVVASHEDRARIEEYSSLKNKIDSLKADILKTFGEASVLVDENNQKIATWNNESRTSIDRDAIEKIHPGILSQFKKINTSRTLRIV